MQKLPISSNWWGDRIAQRLLAKTWQFPSLFYEAICIFLHLLKVAGAVENIKNAQRFFSCFCSFQPYHFQPNSNWCGSPLKGMLRWFYCSQRRNQKSLASRERRKGGRAMPWTMTQLWHSKIQQTRISARPWVSSDQSQGAHAGPEKVVMLQIINSNITILSQIYKNIVNGRFTNCTLYARVDPNPYRGGRIWITLFCISVFCIFISQKPKKRLEKMKKPFLKLHFSKRHVVCNKKN